MEARDTAYNPADSYDTEAYMNAIVQRGVGGTDARLGFSPCLRSETPTHGTREPLPDHHLTSFGSVLSRIGLEDLRSRQRRPSR